MQEEQVAARGGPATEVHLPSPPLLANEQLTAACKNMGDSVIITAPVHHQALRQRKTLGESSQQATDTVTLVEHRDNKADAATQSAPPQLLPCPAVQP